MFTVKKIPIKPIYRVKTRLTNFSAAENFARVFFFADRKFKTSPLAGGNVFVSIYMKYSMEVEGGFPRH